MLSISISQDEHKLAQNNTLIAHRLYLVTCLYISCLFVSTSGLTSNSLCWPVRSTVSKLSLEGFEMSFMQQRETFLWCWTSFFFSFSLPTVCYSSPKSNSPTGSLVTTNVGLTCKEYNVSGVFCCGWILKTACGQSIQRAAVFFGQAHVCVICLCLLLCVFTDKISCAYTSV